MGMPVHANVLRLDRHFQGSGQTINPRFGLDLEKAETDQFFPGITGILNQDAADVEALGIRQTPTFFLNGKRLENFSADSLIADVRFAVQNS